MTVLATRLVPGSQLTTLAVAYYTCPNATGAVIKRADFCNTTGGAVTITVYVVASGGSPGDANTVIKAYSIAAGVTYVSSELSGMALSPGDTLQALASANSSITMVVSGITIV